MDDVLLLKDSVNNNDIAAARSIIKHMARNNHLSGSDLSDIFNIALKSKNKDVIEAVLIVLPREWGNHCFLRCALRDRLSADIIELVQPTREHQSVVLYNLMALECFEDIAHWSKSVNSDALNKKIFENLTPHFLDLQGKHDFKYLADMIQTDIARRQHDEISSALPNTDRVSPVRKI